MKTVVPLYTLIVLASMVSGQSPPPNAPTTPTNKQDQQIDRDFAASKTSDAQTPDAPTNKPLATPEPQATRIKDHKIGETFWVWLSVMAGRPGIAQTDLSALCKSQRRMDWKTKNDCKLLSTIQASGEGVFPSEDNGRTYSWKFNGAKLSELTITFIYARSKFQDELSLLTQAYGDPSRIWSAPYHNAYGAQWESPRALWEMPDGTIILASGDIDFDKQGDMFQIRFVSKEAAARNLLDERSKPNPYK